MWYTVYKITNTLTGRFYVGAHQTNDLNDSYLGSGKILRQAVKKYGRENFSKETLVLAFSVEDMFFLEKILVDEARKDPSCYNLREGGLGGWAYVQSTYTAEKRRNSLEKAQARRAELHATDPKFKLRLSRAIRDTIPRGHDHHCFGLIWIKNDELRQTKRIHKEDLNVWLAKGWVRGHGVRVGYAFLLL